MSRKVAEAQSFRKDKIDHLNVLISVSFSLLTLRGRCDFASLRESPQPLACLIFDFTEMSL